MSIGSYAPKPPAKQAEQVVANVPAKPEPEPEITRLNVRAIQEAYTAARDAAELLDNKTQEFLAVVAQPGALRVDNALVVARDCSRIAHNTLDALVDLLPANAALAAMSAQGSATALVRLLGQQGMASTEWLEQAGELRQHTAHICEVLTKLANYSTIADAPVEPLPQVDPWAAQLWARYGEAQTAAIALADSAIQLQGEPTQHGINRLLARRTRLTHALDVFGTNLPAYNDNLRARLATLSGTLDDIASVIDKLRRHIEMNDHDRAKEAMQNIRSRCSLVCSFLENCKPELTKLAPLGGAR